ncbi:nitronate monooxygenase [Rhodobacterales bacterium HKCCE2091]|nr:nitronate monooxygenase [Rhodobacterales bacterium HKCCE2091]
MPLPKQFEGRMLLPVVCAPMFIISSPELVVAQCTSGFVGTIPSLNIRPQEQLEETLGGIREKIDAYAESHPGAKVAPFGVNLIVHRTNARVEHDLDVCVRQQVPLIITSLGARGDIVERVHDYGGLVFHDVTNLRHARKAISQGVDGIVLVANGAGGHAGATNPIALVRELRAEFDGTILLSGAIADGAGILSALAMGADMAYIGSRFIAVTEANAPPDYKQMIIDGGAADIIYTSAGTGVPANYLRQSFERQGIDPTKLEHRDSTTMDFGGGSSKRKAWRDIWGCGQGIGVVKDQPSMRDLAERLRRQFEEARQDFERRVAASI